MREAAALEISRELFPVHSKDPALRLRKEKALKRPACVCAEEWLFFSTMVDTSYEMMTSPASLGKELLFL